MRTGKPRKNCILLVVLATGFCFISAHAEISCPVEDAGGASTACLGGQCISSAPFMPPCTPPRFVPEFLAWIWCGGSSSGEDGDGTTAVVAQCANECSENNECDADETCITDASDRYSGGGNGLCVASATPPPDEVTDTPPDPTPTGANACSDNETWVTDPTPLHTGGQCQLTAELIECCYLHDELTACRRGVPTECPDNRLCSTSGYCYEANPSAPLIIEPDPARDPAIFPPPPAEARPGG